MHSAWLSVSRAGTLPGTALRRSEGIGRFFTQGRGQINLMVLLFRQDLAELFCQGKFAESFTLPHSFGVIADGFILIIQIKTKHTSFILLRPDGLGSHRRPC